MSKSHPQEKNDKLFSFLFWTTTIYNMNKHAKQFDMCRLTMMENFLLENFIHFNHTEENAGNSSGAKHTEILSQLTDDGNWH